MTAARARSAGLSAVLLLLAGCGLFITPQHRIAVARNDIKTGNWQEAAIELRAVIQRDGAKRNPDDSEVEYHYAYALLAAGKRDEAQRILTRILSASRPFDSRPAAQRLLASVKST